MADRVFLAFANIKNQPLPTLREEDDKLYELFSKREQKGHFKLHRDSYITTRKVGRDLARLKNEIIVFHYSGHAGKSQLFLEDKPAKANHIASFLSECPKLKLIVLNGCSTQGQVRRLLDLETKPVVVATHAPVGDHSATLFSTTFYEYLCEMEKSILESFEAAVKQVKISEKEIDAVRSLARRSSKKEESKAVWGLFPESGARLHWKLPTETMIVDTEDFIPNEILVPKLLQAFAPYADWPKRELEKGGNATEADKVKAVLEPLALPISDQLRKLMTPEQSGSQHEFYDKISKGRLKQIGIACSTVVELIAFILLAELWDHCAKDNKVEIADTYYSELKKFLCLSYDERQEYNFTILIENIRSILAHNEAELFVEEITGLPAFDSVSNEFGAAINYLSSLHEEAIEQLADQDVYHTCKKGEEALATLYSYLAFLTLYSLRSVKTIDVQHYRHSIKPRYSHRVVKLIQTFINKLQEDIDERVEFMYTDSICLLKQGRKDYLNLSPFVIDQNAFGKSKELAKLHYFEVYEKEFDSFTFKHVYKPDDIPLETASDKKTYKVIKEQFDAFTKLLFNQPIQGI